jgi:hypothetical protein
MQGETLLFGSSSKSQWIASYKFRDKFKFESSMNFKGIQTFLKKSNKLSKIPSSHDILEYEFILTHLYSKIGSSFTSGRKDLVQIISKIAGHFRLLCPLLQIHH